MLRQVTQWYVHTAVLAELAGALNSLQAEGYSIFSVHYTDGVFRIISTKQVEQED